MADFVKTKALFESLLAVIGKKRRKYLQSLGQGLTADQIRALISIKPVPEELVAIYSCVKGTSWNDEMGDFIPGFELIAIDEINGVIEKEIAYRDEFITKFGYYDWEPDMIPFLRDYSSDIYCVRTLENDNSVVTIDHEAGIFVTYQNMDHFILSTIECYKQNVYFMDRGILGFSDTNLLKEIINKTASRDD
jgi:hypothetical protein